ncbi:hypothetical protein [Methylophaga sp.]|uniref:hypothetical protein n=1 Tax=Methylophaga sp. TaxID=2024840 RepID=UPI003A9444A2
MRLYVYIVLLMISSNVYSDDFRGSSWGEDIESVKAKETAQLINQYPTQLVYKAQIAGIDMAAAYIFSDSKLVSAMYISDQKYLNKNKHIGDYEKLKELLTTKYGEPLIDDIKWLANLFRDDPQNHGLAISVGQLIYYSEWKSGNTQITNMLGGENQSISLAIIYTDLTTKEDVEAAEKKQAVDQL